MLAARRISNARSSFAYNNRAGIHGAVREQRHVWSWLQQGEPAHWPTTDLLPCDHRIPPGADALQALVVAIQHLQRCAHRLLPCTRPQINRRRLLTADGAEQSVM